MYPGPGYTRDPGYTRIYTAPGSRVCPGPGNTRIPSTQLSLRSKLQSKINSPPVPGRNRPKIIDCLKKMTVRTLPRTPRIPGVPGSRGYTRIYTRLLVTGAAGVDPRDCSRDPPRGRDGPRGGGSGGGPKNKAGGWPSQVSGRGVSEAEHTEEGGGLSGSNSPRTGGTSCHFTHCKEASRTHATKNTQT